MKRVIFEFMYWINERSFLRAKVAKLEEQLVEKDRIIIRAAATLDSERIKRTADVLSLQVHNNLLKDKLDGVS